ncbi:hypothetical protein JTE90_011203 [Oedothorax gibbosus]|uniref:Uncharacterized protein n=1 Tax=Oedothorax gibbosus TaxID=931172 RepID=A0AAV6W1B1_9ARAC|nr:hypothetical protein JTE90_011203 [Oedothorax gibbosus]
MSDGKAASNYLREDKRFFPKQMGFDGNGFLMPFFGVKRWIRRPEIIYFHPEPATGRAKETFVVGKCKNVRSSYV